MRKLAPALVLTLCFFASGLFVSAAAAQDDGEPVDGASSDERGSSSRRITIDQPHSGSRPWTIDVHGGFTWFGVGVQSGARLGIPLVENGFVDSINNAVYLNFGIDFYFARATCRAPPMGGGCDWSYGPGVGFPVTLHWEFYLNETWSVFAEVGAQFFLHPAFFENNNRFEIYDGGYWFIGQVGGVLHLSDFFQLVLRVGTPYASFGMRFSI